MHLPLWIWLLIYGLTSRNAADWVDAQFYSITYWIGWVYSTAYDWVTWLIQTGVDAIVWTHNTLVKWVDWLIDIGKVWVEWLRDAGKALIDWLLKEVDKIWTFAKDTLEKALNQLIAWSTQFIEYVTKAFTDLWAYAKSIYDSVVVWIDDLWEGLKALWNQFVDWVNEVIDTVYTYIEDLYGQIMDQVLKWVNEVQAHLTAKITGVFDYFNSWLKEILDWAVKKFNELTVNVEHIFSFLEDAFEDSFTLTVNAVVGTVSKHGLRLLRELWDFVLPEPTAEDTARLNQIHLASEIEKHVTMIDNGKDSEWGDISDNIDRVLEAMDRDEDPPDLDLNDSLLPPDERAERDQAGQWLDDWYQRQL